MCAMVNRRTADAQAPDAVSASRGKFDLKGGRLFGPTTVIDGIVAEISAKIAAGEIGDGEALPSQDDLAQALGVSRASLREALNRLAVMGLVEIKHGKGTFVRTARPQALMNSLSSLLILDQPSAGELLEALLHVESALVALAAMNASAEELGHMKDWMGRMESGANSMSLDRFILYDTRLHALFAKAARNPVLEKVMDILWSALPQRIREITSLDAIPTFLDCHRRIYDAIARHDPAAARQEMERHLHCWIDQNSRLPHPGSRSR
jgi:GntR family transcriptional repressor for pyruvate dehydrogenase complex